MTTSDWKDEAVRQNELLHDALNRAKAAEDKLAKAVDALRAVQQHEASAFFGPDAEKNQRASWRGVRRNVKDTLAELGEAK